LRPKATSADQATAGKPKPRRGPSPIPCACGAAAAPVCAACGEPPRIAAHRFPATCTEAIEMLHDPAVEAIVWCPHAGGAS
jgi:hypothetical protein